jgi:LPS O-antigen subunit length determinant protein (WzzB/FepE family)
MQEKIGQYNGIKYGEDLANKLTNKTLVTIPPPVYSTAILLRHQEWERQVRRKQMNMKTALDAKLAQLQSASGIQDAVAIAEVKNPVKDVAYHQGQEVPYNLTDSEKLKYSNKSKMHSHRVATLEKHQGNVYALIYGQCTQILQDKMKQDKNWVTVSVSYKPLELYKLIERVILKQTEDQYPVAALWEQ